MKEKEREGMRGSLERERGSERESGQLIRASLPCVLLQQLHEAVQLKCPEILKYEVKDLTRGGFPTNKIMPELFHMYSLIYFTDNSSAYYKSEYCISSVSEKIDAIDFGVKSKQ